MKMREKIKRFWTMDVHSHEGFTLVELIIVIAILAILSSVAVVGYSSYIEKANKQADATLIAQVKHALELHYYNEMGAAGGWVKLSADGATADADFGAAAMEAALGANWQTTAKLVWGDWKADSTFNSALNMSREDADAVVNSNYVTGGVESAIENVANLTDTALGFLVKKLDNPDYTTAMMYSAMALNFCGNDKAAFAELCKKNGIAVNADGTDFAAGTDRDTLQNQLSNLMVLSTAGDYANYIDGDNATTSIATDLMIMYAGFTAAANSEYGSDVTDLYDEMNANLTKANSVEEVSTILDDFYNNDAVKLMMYNYANDSTGMSTTDGTALYNILKTVDSTSGSLSAEDMSSSNLFATDGIIADAFSGYVSTAGMVSGGLLEGVTVADGEVLIYLYVADDGSVIIDTSSTIN